MCFRSSCALAKKYHVELVPAWLLVRLAGETLGKKLEMRKLFRTYIKEGGGPIDQFLKEAFTKRKEK